MTTTTKRREQKLWDEINLLDRLIVDLQKQRNDRLRQMKVLTGTRNLERDLITKNGAIGHLNSIHMERFLAQKEMP